MAIFIFNVPARTMKRERFALAGVPLLTSFMTYFKGVKLFFGYLYFLLYTLNHKYFYAVKQSNFYALIEKIFESFFPRNSLAILARTLYLREFVRLLK